MRLNIALLIAMILALTAFTSFALAGNPLEEDKLFLLSDPDNDGLMTYEEFILGTDPFNSDSDNDGLPDGWEKEYLPTMDPADSSDAHKDFDYDPSSNATGFNIGESEALTYQAVKTLKNGQSVVWPGNPDVKFDDIIYDIGETEKHYDNYEEYYRPYTVVVQDEGDVIRYMHTNPLNPDTDGDGILDPEDYEPLGWANDGTSPGSEDSYEVEIQPDIDVKVNGDVEVLELQANDYDIEIYIKSITESQTPNDSNKKSLPDADNDGF